MEQAVALVAIALFGNKLLELVKRVRAKDVNGSVTIIVLWVIGAIVLTVCAHFMLTQDAVIPTTQVPIGKLDGGSLIFLGMLVTSTGAFGYDLTKAIDRFQTSRQPTLMPTPTPNPNPEG